MFKMSVKTVARTNQEIFLIEEFLKRLHCYQTISSLCQGRERKLKHKRNAARPISLRKINM